MPDRFPLWKRALHIFVLTSFAVAQPVLERLSENRRFLQTAGIQPAALLVLLIFVCLLAPAALILIEIAVRPLGRSALVCIHAIFVAVLLGAIALPVMSRLVDLPGVMTVPIAALASIAATRLYVKHSWAGWLVAAASPGIVVFPGAFLLAAPVRALLSPPPVQADPRLEVRDPHPVVLLVFDAFCGTTLMNESRAIDELRYPNFAALARTSTWCRNASAVHPRTEFAVPALLTGRYPRGDRRPVDAEYPGTLFRILQATRKYRQTVFEPFTNLFPVEFDDASAAPVALSEQFRLLWSCLATHYLHDVAPADLHAHLPEIPREWFRVKTVRWPSLDKRTGLIKYGWSQERMQQFEHFLDCIQDDGRPAFFFKHAVLPHMPWSHYPSGSRYASEMEDMFTAPGLVNQGENWIGDELAVAQGMQRYVLQACLADRLVGKTMERLKQAGLFDRSLIVVVADHGTAFQANEPMRWATSATADEIMSIPLFIKTPRQKEGRISDRNVELVDVLPSILDVLGIRYPDEFDGGSVFDPNPPSRTHKTLVREDGSILRRPAVLDHGPALDRMLRTVGCGQTPEKLYALGPHPELIGRSTRELAAPNIEPALTTLLVRSERANLFHVQRLVAGYFRGRILNPSALDLPIELAIAVNGKVVAVTRTYLLDKRRFEWSVLVPEESFGPGHNDVEVFEVRKSSGGLSLQRLRIHDAANLNS